jgi:catechol 2,3-dioxygenase-like lactoylglutathione lyase family enzyme
MIDMMSLSAKCIWLALLISQPLTLTGWMLAREWSFLKNNRLGRPSPYFSHHVTSRFQQSDKSSIAEEKNPSKLEHASSIYIHHTAIKTRNITTAIQFYSLLGFTLSCKFRAGPARAAWLEFPNDDPHTTSSLHSSTCCRLEIIEVPPHMLNEQDGTRKRAIGLMERQDLLGHNHLALDVTNQIMETTSFKNNVRTAASLQIWMDNLNETSVKAFGKQLRVALAPRQQLIGSTVYELAFVYDADGALVELLYKQCELEQDIQSGWEPWDGNGFIGKPMNQTNDPPIIK